MRSLFISMAAALLLLTACGRKPEPQLVAAHTARLYYEYLAQGKYKAFVEGMYLPDSVPESYIAMHVANAQSYKQRQDSLHGGIRSVRVVSQKFNAKDSTAQVYLDFTFGDKSTEQVLVPMVCSHNIWYMK